MSREWLSLSVFCFKVCLSTPETYIFRDSNVDRTGMRFDNQYMFSLVNVIYSQSVGSVGSKELLAPPCRGDLESANLVLFQSNAISLRERYISVCLFSLHA